MNVALRCGFDWSRRCPLLTTGTFTLLAAVNANVVTYSDAGVAFSTTYCYKVGSDGGRSISDWAPAP